MRRAGGQAASVVVAGVMLAWPAAGAAQDWDLQASYGAARVVTPRPGVRRPYGPIADLLGSGDQIRIATAWSSQIERQSGGFDVTTFTSRFRSAGSRDDPSLVDRFAIRTGGVRLATALTGDLTLWGATSLSLMKRHYELTPAGARGLSTIIATAGLGIARSEGGWIGLDYIDSAARHTRSAVDRIIEQSRGGPGTSNGLRLTLSTGGPGDTGRGPNWSLALASLRRPLVDSPPASGRGALSDNRAELRFRLPL